MFLSTNEGILIYCAKEGKIKNKLIGRSFLYNLTIRSASLHYSLAKFQLSLKNKLHLDITKNEKHVSAFKRNKGKHYALRRKVINVQGDISLRSMCSFKFTYRLKYNCIFPNSTYAMLCLSTIAREAYHVLPFVSL